MSRGISELRDRTKKLIRGRGMSEDVREAAVRDLVDEAYQLGRDETGNALAAALRDYLVSRNLAAFHGTVVGLIPSAANAEISASLTGLIPSPALSEIPGLSQVLPLSDDDSELEADAAQQRAAFCGEPLADGDADDEILRAKWMIDGAATLEQAADMAGAFADELRRLAASGWRLRGPVEDDWGFLVKDPSGQETGQ